MIITPKGALGTVLGIHAPRHKEPLLAEDEDEDGYAVVIYEGANGRCWLIRVGGTWEHTMSAQSDAYKSWHAAQDEVYRLLEDGCAMLTPEMVSKIVNLIGFVRTGNEHCAGDDEVAYALEDALNRAVLLAIAYGHPQPAQMALEAIRLRER